jgi:glycosyltransferase involved in cell wall biosynthesis
VRWLGYCIDPLALLRAADLFVFFSHSEGLSLALLEAMATGLPIVASDIPSNVEALAGTGVTVPLSDPRRAAAAILALIADPARRDALGRAARARAILKYPIQRFVGDLERLFDRWATAPAPGGR